MKERQINTQINRMMSSRASSLLRRASGGFEPSAADRTRTRAAIARRLVIGAAAGAAVAAGAKSAAAAPASLAPAAVTTAAATTTVAPTAIATFASVGFATKFVAAVAIVGTVSAGAVTVHHVTRSNLQSGAQTTSQNSSPHTTPQVIAANPIAPPVTWPQAMPIPIPIAADDLPVDQVAPIANPGQITAIHDAPAKLERVVAKPVSNDLPNAPAQIASPENQKAAALQTGAENDLLQRAMQALQANDAEKALALLNEHAQRFPNGMLAEDRDAERVLALCAAGRQSEAAKMGAAFLSAHPTSTSASRIRSSCANGGANDDAPTP